MVLSLAGAFYAEEQLFWNNTGNTYLYSNENGGLTRVITDSYGWASDKKVYIESYNSGFKLRFGQPNPNEEDTVEVIRVVKYSKSWERLGQASIYGANTAVSFVAGSCRCAESDGMPYIHTCHQTYKTEDGLNHQANMMPAIHESDMSITFLDKPNSGYVSHSFDQYMIAG